MEHEMRSIEKDFVLLQDTHDRTVLELTLARGYLKSCSTTARSSDLAQKHADLLPEFQHIVEAAPLEGRFPQTPGTYSPAFRCNRTTVRSISDRESVSAAREIRRDLGKATATS